jgi:hypothetical protein
MVQLLSLYGHLSIDARDDTAGPGAAKKVAVLTRERARRCRRALVVAVNPTIRYPPPTQKRVGIGSKRPVSVSTEHPKRPMEYSVFVTLKTLQLRVAG